MREIKQSGMFVSTPRFKYATSLLNGIHNEKVKILLKFVNRKLCDGEDAMRVDEADIGRLLTAIQFNLHDLTTIVDVSTFIFEKAAYDGVTQEILSVNLARTGLHHAKCKIFARVWKEIKPKAISHFMKKIVAGPVLVSFISWKVNMKVGKSSIAKLKDPSVVFCFNTSDSTGTVSDFAVTLSHEKLYRLFSSLELIQKQLDTLSR